MREFMKQLLEKYSTIDRIDPKNNFNQRRERHVEILEKLLEVVKGDILEIGAYEGESTKKYVELAKKFNRTVFVVDPWDGAQEGNTAVFNKFVETITPLVADNPNRVKVIKKSSKDPLVRQELSKVKLAFALCDGMHNYEHAMNDMQLASQKLVRGGIMCMDDIRGIYSFNPEIMKAYTEFNPKGLEKIETPNNIQEGYFIKC